MVGTCGPRRRRNIRDERAINFGAWSNGLQSRRSARGNLLIGPCKLLLLGCQRRRRTANRGTHRFLLRNRLGPRQFLAGSIPHCRLYIRAIGRTGRRNVRCGTRGLGRILPGFALGSVVGMAHGRGHNLAAVVVRWQWGLPVVIRQIGLVLYAGHHSAGRHIGTSRSEQDG